VYLDCDLFVLFHTFPNYIRLYNLIKLNNVLCILAFDLLYATCIYTYLLCALTTESSNITTSNIFILFWLVTTCIIKKTHLQGHVTLLLNTQTFVEGLLRLANVLEATNGTLKNVNNILYC
jgi:hypothetical protein